MAKPFMQLENQMDINRIKRARKIARKIVVIAQGSAGLKGQGVDKETIKKAEDELVKKYLGDA